MRTRGHLAHAAWLLALTMSGTVAAQQPRIGHVDFAKLIRSAPAYGAAQEALTAYADTRVKQLSELQEELDLHYAQLESGQTVAARSERETRLGEIRALELRIEELGATAEGALLLREQELLEPIAASVRELVSTVATERGLDYVVDADASFLIHRDPRNDLTDVVARRLAGR